MNVNSEVVQAIRKNLGLEPDDRSKDGDIATMSRREQLERFCAWHGIIGYSAMIRIAVSEIYGVYLKE